jgi:hypothetical protein
MRFPRRTSSRLFLLALALVISSVAIRGHAQSDSCNTSISQLGDASLQLFLKNGQTVSRRRNHRACGGVFIFLGEEALLEHAQL